MNIFDLQVGLVPAVVCMAASAVAGAVMLTLWWYRMMAKRENVIDFLCGIYEGKPEELEEFLNDVLTHKSVPIKGTPDDFILPGWFCPRCDVFNGEGKNVRTECRVCELRYIRETPEIPVKPG